MTRPLTPRDRLRDLLADVEALKARKVERRNLAPDWAPWLPKLRDACTKCVERLYERADEEDWPDDLLDKLIAVLNIAGARQLAHLTVWRKPEPRNVTRWYRVFASWFLLIPADLKAAALDQLAREEARRHEPTGAPPLWRWLDMLAAGLVCLPDGMTPETMGEVIGAVIGSRDNMSWCAGYCTGCSLLRPMRERGTPAEIMPACPYCGASGWRWETYLGR